MEKKEQKKWEDLTPKEKKMYKIAYSVLLSSIVFVISIVVIFSGSDGKSKDKKKDYNDMSEVLPYFAEKLIVPQLKYPDGWGYESKRVVRVDNTTYKLIAVVLVKNGFGVRSRAEYLLQIRYVGSIEDSYKYEEYYDFKNWTILANRFTDYN